MAYMFDIERIIKESELSEKKINKLKKEVRQDYPTDEMMYELHLMRAIESEKNKSLSPRKKLQQLKISSKQSKKELRTMLKKVWAKTRDIPEKEIEKLVDEAVKTTRAKTKRTGKAK